MKNICFFSGDITRTGGTERVSSIIANALAERYGDTAQIFILSLFETNDAPVFPISDRIKRVHLFDRPISLKRCYLTALLKLRKFLKANNIETIIDIDVILSILTIPATIGLKTRVISWEHFHFHENLGCRIRDWGRKLAMRYADAVVTLTDADLKNYLAASPKAKVARIYNPVIPPKTEVRYNVESKTILSVGRLTYQKGFDMIPEIAAPVFAKFPDWKWVIVGEGEDREKIESEIEKYSLGDNILLPGKTNNIAAFYQDAALFVLSSRYEGFGLVLTEALSHKLPCVISICPHGPDEIVTDGINGVHIPCFDKQVMSDKIIELIINAEKRREMSTATVQVYEKFGISPILGNWHTMLFPEEHV